MKGCLVSIAAIIIIALGVFGFIYLMNPNKIDEYIEYVDGKINPKQSTYTNPSILDSMRELKEYVTAHYYEETLAKDRKRGEEIAIIYGVNVMAGFDLEEIEEDLVWTNDERTFLSVVLPEPKIIDVTCNPFDKKVLKDSKKWSDDDLRKLETDAKNIVMTNAIKSEILDEAKDNAVESLRNLFMAFGYSKDSIGIEFFGKVQTPAEFMYFREGREIGWIPAE